MDIATLLNMSAACEATAALWEQGPEPLPADHNTPSTASLSSARRVYPRPGHLFADAYVGAAWDTGCALSEGNEDAAITDEDYHLMLRLHRRKVKYRASGVVPQRQALHRDATSRLVGVEALPTPARVPPQSALPSYAPLPPLPKQAVKQNDLDCLTRAATPKTIGKRSLPSSLGVEEAPPTSKRRKVAAAEDSSVDGAAMAASKAWEAVGAADIDAFEAERRRERGTDAAGQKKNDAKLIKVQKKLMRAIAVRDIPKAYRHYKAGLLAVQVNTRTLARACQKEVNKQVLKSQRIERETPNRCKKMMREIMNYWRRNEKEERENRRRAEKEEVERRKKDDQIREARRQQKKFNFLLTQTELYAHFMQRKLKGGAEGEDGEQEAILSKLDIDRDGRAAPASEDDLLDNAVDQEESDAVLRSRALQSAEIAVNRQQERARKFDLPQRKQPAATSEQVQGEFDGSFSLANPVMSSERMLMQPKIFHGMLKPYQLKGMNWLASLYDQGINGILADEMGLGKTIQSIATLTYLAETENIWGPFLIIAPKSTVHNWASEFERFAPDLKVLPYWCSGSDRKILRQFWNSKHLSTRHANFHVLITTYTLAVTDEKYLQRLQWQYMILDEAQSIKSSASQRFSALSRLHCRNRLLLTGTPIQNTMKELWALLNFIMPTLFDSHEEFSEWFSKDIESHAQEKTNVLNQTQLSRLHKVLKPFMLRRIKRDVEVELGEKIEKEVYCELALRQRAMYQTIKETLRLDDRLFSTDKPPQSLMNILMQFRKVCNHPELFERHSATAPFVFDGPRWSTTPRFGPGTFDDWVPYSTVNPISFRVPKLIFRELMLPAHEHGGFSHTDWLCGPKLGILTAEHVQQSLFPAAEAGTESTRTFSFLRFCDVSVGEFCETAAGSLWDRLLLQVVASAHAAVHENYGTLRRLFLSCGPATGLPNVTPCAKELRSLLSPLPTVVAPPIVLECADSMAAHRILTFASGSALDVSAAAVTTAPSKLDLRQYHRGLVTRALEYMPPCGLLQQVQPVTGWSFIQLPGRMRLLTDCDKLQKLDSLLFDLKRGGHRVLIYSQMTRMLDLLEEYLYFRKHKFLRMDGSSASADRRDMVTDFQNRPDIFIFLLSTRAGGLGITLTAADTVIFYDSDWNPTVDQQAMDRAHRLGQTRQVTVYRLITKDTVEEKILKRAQQKSEIHKMVITGQQAAFRNDALRSDEVVSLLLDDAELAAQINDKQRLEKLRTLAKAAEREEAMKKRKRPETSGPGAPTAAKRPKLVDEAV